MEFCLENMLIIIFERRASDKFRIEYYDQNRLREMFPQTIELFKCDFNFIPDSFLSHILRHRAPWYFRSRYHLRPYDYQSKNFLCSRNKDFSMIDFKSCLLIGRDMTWVADDLICCIC